MKEHFEKSASTLSLAGMLLPLYYPFLARGLYQRTELLRSTSPGNLSHSRFFSKPENYYRGMSANLWLLFLYPATELVLSELIGKIEQYQNRPSNLLEQGIATFMTGSATALFANPYDVTVIKSQQTYSTPMPSFSKVIETQGISGFYRGIVPMAIRNGTFLTGLYFTTPKLQRYISTYCESFGKLQQPVSMFMAACAASAIFTVVATPLDVLSVLRQSDPSGKIHPSTWNVCKKVYNRHGLFALGTGASMRMAASLIETAGFNAGKQLMENDSFIEIPKKL